MHWRRKWPPTPVFLPGEPQGRGILVGCPLWGHTESDTTERLHFHFHSHALEKEMAIHSSVLAWRIPGTGSRVGRRLWGHTESDMTEALSSSSSGCAGRQNPEPGAKITYNFPSGPSLGAFEPRVVKFLVASHQTASCFPMQGEVGGHKDHNTVEMMHRHRSKAINGRKQFITPHSLTQDAQSCPTLCDPMDHSPPGSSVHGSFQARILEWVAVSSSRGSS